MGTPQLEVDGGMNVDDWCRLLSYSYSLSNPSGNTQLVVLDVDAEIKVSYDILVVTMWQKISVGYRAYYQVPLI